MSLKMKLTSAIIMFMLILSTLVIGVLAAKSQTISMKGNVSFNINDRSLYLKSVRYKVGNDATEPVTLENFLPGYIDTNMEVNIGDHEFNYSAFTLYFDIVNTTANTYNAVEEVTLSQGLISQGVTASASGKISPTQEIDSDGDNYAEIMPTSEPTGTITLTVTSTSTQAINLGDITITIEQYVPINYSELGYTFSGNSITGYTGTATDLVIPSSYKIDENGKYIEDLDGTGTSITRIADDVFQNNTTLTSITIPETVTSIGKYAFAGCTALQTIDLSNSQITSIPDYAFQDNLALTSITIPDTVISIGQYAFDGCINLLNVNLSETSQLQTIGNYAFQDCTSLTTITIPEAVINIGNNSFLNCYALAIVYDNSSLEITVGDAGNGWVGRYAKEVVTASNPQVGRIETINNINYYINETKSEKIALVPAVARNTLTSVTLEIDTTEINQYAFYNCSSLQIDFSTNSSLQTIGSHAFARCTSLTTITIPDTVTSIWSFAFLGCTSLQTVNFGNNSQLQTIGGSAFYGCTSLTTITIPETVTSIGSAAFDDCSNLQYNNNGGGKYLGSATNPYFALIDTHTTTFTSITINSNCKVIASAAFRWCSSLQNVDFNNCQITTIPDDAFSYCRSLTTITIPETVTSIGGLAFYDCTSLTTITIPKTVTSIGNSAFYCCCALAIVYNNSGLTITAGDSDNGYVGYYAKEVVTDGQADGIITEENNIFYYNNETTKSALGPKRKRSSITSVTLDSDTTEINKSAFYDCSSLTTITIPETVEAIGYYAFDGCFNLQTVDIGTNSQLQTIGESAFQGCSSLTTITIPNTVTSIGDFAFQGCSSLTTVVIESQDVYNNATSADLCGNLLEYVQTVKVLTSVVNGTNAYLTDTSYFPYTWTEGNYTVYSKTAQS